MDISNVALDGLHRAEVKLEKAATRIASFRADSSGGTNTDTVDLSAEMVAVNVGQERVFGQPQKSRNRWRGTEKLDRLVRLTPFWLLGRPTRISIREIRVIRGLSRF